MKKEHFAQRMDILKSSIVATANLVTISKY